MLHLKKDQDVLGQCIDKSRYMKHDDVLGQCIVLSVVFFFFILLNVPFFFSSEYRVLVITASSMCQYPITVHDRRGSFCILDTYKGYGYEGRPVPWHGMADNDSFYSCASNYCIRDSPKNTILYYVNTTGHVRFVPRTYIRNSKNGYYEQRANLLVTDGDATVQLNDKVMIERRGNIFQFMNKQLHIRDDAVVQVGVDGELFVSH